jgi:hypothetical protein
MNVGQANCDIHNFGHYLYKLLDTNALYWERLALISPDYDLLNDHNESYFIDTKKIVSEGLMSREAIVDQTRGRKINIRGKNVVLVYNDKVDRDYILNNPFSVAMNRESDSLHTLLINYNTFVRMVAEKDYNAIYALFDTFFKWLYGKETPQGSLHALITYIDVVHHDLKLEKIGSMIDYNIAKSTDIVSQVLMSKFRIPNPHGVASAIMDNLAYDSAAVYAELFYYPSVTVKILEAGNEPEFNLKAFLAIIDDVFANQKENVELRNAFIDQKYFNDATIEADAAAKYTKHSFVSILEVEERLDQQVDLLFEMSEGIVHTTMDIIYKAIDDAIEKYGIVEGLEPETEEEKKERLESDIEAQIKAAIDGMDIK